ncbi:hypothetical protein G3I17_19135 [Streptomyces sp. SID13031]|nr:hypothetical protein [Streptomyces sp. SID13031]
MRPSRRQIFLAGTVAAVSTVAAAEAAAAGTGPYGSGDLGSWQTLTKAESGEAIIRNVLAKDGVFMFGDSIAVQDGKSLAIRLAGRTGDALAVHNWSGRPTVPAVDALQKWAEIYGLPRRILMATGTYDIFNPPIFAAQVDRTMSIAGPDRVVIWVNVHIARTTSDGKPAATQLADQRNSVWVNLQLADAQKRHPNLRIVRWAEYLAAKPDRVRLYLRGGLYTSVPAGQDSRNELTVQALAAAKTA